MWAGRIAPAFMLEGRFHRPGGIHGLVQGTVATVEEKAGKGPPERLTVGGIYFAADGGRSRSFGKVRRPRVSGPSGSSESPLVLRRRIGLSFRRHLWIGSRRWGRCASEVGKQVTGQIGR
jgi:hypothetical protein